MSVLDDDIQELVTTELVRKAPGGGLVNSHKWSLNYKTFIHAEIERYLQRLDRLIPAVRVTRKVGLAHPSNDDFMAASISNRRCRCEKKNVSPWNKRRGKTVFAHLDGHFANKGRVADRLEKSQFKYDIFTEPLRPNGEL